MENKPNTQQPMEGKAKVIKVPDLTGLSQKEKDELVSDFGQLVTAEFMTLFYALDLKTHIHFKVTDQVSGDKFELHFNKLNPLNQTHE